MVAVLVRARRMPLVAAPLLVATSALEMALDDPRPGATLVVVTSLALGLAFVLQAWVPVVGAVAVALAYPVSVVAGAPGITGIGLVGLLLAAGHVASEVSRRTSPVTVVAMMAAVVLTDLQVHGPTWEIVFLPLTLLPAGWVGRLVRRERRRSTELLDLTRQLEEQREAAERAAVAAERARIAREVHDSVAHSVSVMTLQTGGVRRQLADVLATRPHEEEVLLGLERLGRQTVDELRGLVGLLRRSGEGLPAEGPASLDRLDDLAADARAAGLVVDVDVRGEPDPLPRALDLSAFRIVQEALTNVMRHAPGQPARVVLTYAADAVTLEVTNPTAGSRPATSPGGHGLLGMRERAALFGGTVTVEPSPSTFRVRAHLPVRTSWA